MKSHVWIKNQQVVGQIIIPKTADAHERYAAEELMRYFEKIAGARTPIVEGIRHRTKPSIILLDASRPSNRAFLRRLPLEALKWDGFMIQTRGRDLYIVAQEPAGLVYGMYQYLSLVLGVCFHDYGPEGEDIPYRDTIEHGSLAIVKNPRLPYRSLQQVMDVRRMDWMIKNGFNYVRYHCAPTLEWWDAHLPALAVELKKRGLKIAFGHHLFEKIMPARRYLDDHPDYYPLVNGRRGEQPQFPWSLKNKAVVDEVIFVLTQFLERHPEIDMLDYWPADGIYRLNKQDYADITGEAYQHGEWEKRVHGASPTGRMGDPNKAKLYALMILPVAEALGRRFPRLKISTLHYVDLVQPCPDVRFPDNVVPFIAIYWRCIKHDLLNDTCEYNAQFKRIITEWTRQYPDRWICLYEYYMGMGCHAALPYPCLTSLFAEWDHLITLGISGAHIQSNDYHAVPYNLNYLAFAALAWENPPTLNQFLNAYCREFFGTAGKSVLAMYRLWEEGIQRAKASQPGVAFFGWMFSPEHVRKCRALLEKAIRTTRDPKAIYRISRLIILMEYARLALTIAPWYLRKALAQRLGKNTETLDLKIAPKLEPIVQFFRRLEELGQDIVGTSSRRGLSVPARLMAGDITARMESNNWERNRGQLKKQAWACKLFDADVAEAALAKRRRDGKKQAK